jgi:hypothetical protein
MTKADWNKDIVIDWDKVDRIRAKAYKVLEILFLIVLCIYFFEGGLESSTLGFQFPGNYYGVLPKLITWIVLLKVICSYENYKKIWLPLVASGVVCELVYQKVGFDIQLYMWIFLVGAVGVDYKKIMKAFFWCGFSVLAASMLASFSGIAQHLIYVKEDRLRYSFGICYPTDFGAYFLFTSFAGWVSYGQGRNLLMSFLFLAEAAFLYIFCVAWCSSIVAVLAAVMALYIYFTEKYSKSFLLKKLIAFLEQWAFIICGAVMLTVTLLYDEDSPFFLKLNSALSGRLELGKRAFNKYGVHLLGRYFPMLGNGGNDFSSPVYYNFVDSSYCLILVRYGLLLFIVFAAFYLIAAYRAKKSASEVLLAVLALTAVQSMIEHHWSDLKFNPCLILAFTSLAAGEKESIKAGVKKEKSDIVFRVLAAAYVAALAFLLTPFSSLLRTLGRAKFRLASCNLGFNKYTYFILLLIAGVIFIVWGLWDKSRRIWLLGLGLACHVIVAVISVEILTSRYDYYKQDLDNDDNLRHIIEYAQGENCDLYVDTVPVYYKKYGYDVQNKLVLGNGLCTRTDAIMVVDVDEEYHRLLSEGYIYCQVSDNNAVYTDNAAVIEELERMKLSIVYEFEDEEEDDDTIDDIDWEELLGINYYYGEKKL